MTVILRVLMVRDEKNSAGAGFAHFGRRDAGWF